MSDTTVKTGTIDPAIAPSPDDVCALIEEFAALSEPDGQPGVTRLAYTRLERTAHDLFADRMRRLGLTVWTDAAGNTIAEAAGEKGWPALGTGSHLDSVPQGGSFDGVAGVVAAMEVARTLVSNDTRHLHPFRFVVFAAEEGARFGQACTGSRIAAGMTGSADLSHLVDADGTSIEEAMASVDIDPRRVGEAAWVREEWAAFIELHIEQGSVLSNAGIPVGVVDVISGSTRLTMDVRGRASHSGGTPMHLRADALAASAEIVLAAEALANDDEHRGTRITIGRLEAMPGSITTIAGHCRLHIDIRDVDSDRQRDTATALIALANRIAQDRGVEIRSELLADASPAVLPVWLRNSIVDSAAGLGLDYRVMPSGASHDAQMINHVCPAGMIFVPSRNHGISHSPEEYTRFDDIVRGIEVLTDSLISLDKHLGEGLEGSVDQESH